MYGKPRGSPKHKLYKYIAKTDVYEEKNNTKKPNKFSKFIRDVSFEDDSNGFIWRDAFVHGNFHIWYVNNVLNIGQTVHSIAVGGSAFINMVEKKCDIYMYYIHVYSARWW